MQPRPEQITIAVTVYSRREYVLGAIRSALNQTIPVKVMVVEDCGPDPGIRELIEKEFGGEIKYCRNERRRGLFDNWNACLEFCATEWISILHDDDQLKPNFVETMLKLAQVSPGNALYFGRASVFEEGGVVARPEEVCWKNNWRKIEPTELAESCYLTFPGHLFEVDQAKKVGGFRSNSFLTGDWDMWFRLSTIFGGAQTAEEVARVRSHEGFDRGTSRVNRMGWKYILDNVQRKRNLEFLRREKAVNIVFDRMKPLRSQPISSRDILRYAEGFSRRLLAYNSKLFLHSSPPSVDYALLQMIVRLFGPSSMRFLSFVFNRAPLFKRRTRFAG